MIDNPSSNQSSSSQSRSSSASTRDRSPLIRMFRSMGNSFFVGWRYVYRRNALRLPIQLLALFLVLVVIGAALFFTGTWQSVAAIIMAVGIIGGTTAALSLAFSTFTTISVVGLAFGVATLIWVLSVTSGFYDEFRRKVLGVNAHVIVLKYGVDFTEYRDVIKTIEKVPDVRAAAPFVFNEMMLAKGNSLSGVLVKGVDPVGAERVLDLPQHLKNRAGAHAQSLSRLLNSNLANPAAATGELPGIVIGRELAEKVDAHTGDVVRVISPLANLDAMGWSSNAIEMPRSRDFRVTAIFDSGFAEYDKRLVYVHMKEAQAFFDRNDVVTGVEIKIADVFSAKTVARRIADTLERGIYRTVDWSELNRNLFSALQMQKVVLELLIGFMVVVASFNILAALTVLVIRKTREVAILKSMGMTRRQIVGVFLSTGLIVWFVGTTLGLLWGYFGAVALRFYRFPLDPKVYLIAELPVKLRPEEFLLTAAFTLLICLVATGYPSLRAARVDPVQGLRFS